MTSRKRAYHRRILPDKPDGNKVVTHELVVVLPWFLEAEKKNDELLDPEGCLHEVVQLELGFHLPVRITYDMYGRSEYDYLARMVD